MTKKELEVFITAQVDHRVAELEQRVSALEREALKRGAGLPLISKQSANGERDAQQP
jgi:hypothetical protein